MKAEHVQGGHGLSFPCPGCDATVVIVCRRDKRCERMVEITKHAPDCWTVK